MCYVFIRIPPTISHFCIIIRCFPVLLLIILWPTAVAQAHLFMAHVIVILVGPCSLLSREVRCLLLSIVIGVIIHFFHTSLFS